MLSVGKSPTCPPPPAAATCRRVVCRALGCRRCVRRTSFDLQRRNFQIGPNISGSPKPCKEVAPPVPGQRLHGPPSIPKSHQKPSEQNQHRITANARCGGHRQRNRSGPSNRKRRKHKKTPGKNSRETQGKKRKRNGNGQCSAHFSLFLPFFQPFLFASCRFRFSASFLVAMPPPRLVLVLFI